MLDGSVLRHVPRPAQFPSVRSSLAEGVRYAVATPTVLWPLVLLGGMAMLAMNFQTLLPFFTRDTLGMDSGGYGALFAAMGAGSLVGSLMPRLRQQPAADARLIVGGGAAFLALELRARLRAQPAARRSRCVIGIGLASMLMVNTINVTIQNSVPDALRGRVMSLYVTVFAGTAPIGGLFAGALAEAFGAPVAFSLGAGLAVSGPRPGGMAAASVRLPPAAALRTARRLGGPTRSAIAQRRPDAPLGLVSMSNLPES